MSDKDLIKRLGGPTAVAKKLGYQMPQGVARVANWMRRGIPAKVKLDNLNLFVVTPASGIVIDRKKDE